MIKPLFEIKILKILQTACNLSLLVSIFKRKQTRLLAIAHQVQFQYKQDSYEQSNACWKATFIARQIWDLLHAGHIHSFTHVHTHSRRHR